MFITLVTVNFSDEEKAIDIPINHIVYLKDYEGERSILNTIIMLSPHVIIEVKETREQIHKKIENAKLREVKQ